MSGQAGFVRSGAHARAFNRSHGLHVETGAFAALTCSLFHRCAPSRGSYARCARILIDKANSVKFCEGQGWLGCARMES